MDKTDPSPALMELTLTRGDEPANETISGSGKCCERNQAGGRDERIF